MAAPSLVRFRKEIAIAAVGALVGALMALASLAALDWLSARLSFACRRLVPVALAPPHAAPWRVAPCQSDALLRSTSR